MYLRAIAASFQSEDCAEGLPPVTAASHRPVQSRPPPPSTPLVSHEDDELRMILELSKKEQEDAERRIREEEEELQKILELSLKEK